MDVIFYCSNCNKTYKNASGSENVCPECKNPLYDSQLPVDNWRRLTQEQKDTTKEYWRAEITQHNKNKENMILTTCPFVDGKYVSKQLGLVYGEVVFKAGFGKSLSAVMDNLDDMFSFNSKELSGTMRLLSEAREYAIDKMIKQAAGRCANAIIGIDLESSSGGDIMHIMISGTAVFLEDRL